jgi:hypothetical protein
MKELNMSEQSTSELPCETGAAVPAAQPEAINLLEVLEICSDLCVTHPARLLQILEDARRFAGNHRPRPSSPKLCGSNVPRSANGWSKFID